MNVHNKTSPDDSTTHSNQLGGVMVRVPNSIVEGCGFDPWPIKPKTLKLAFSAFLLSLQHFGIRSKTGQPRVRIMCLGKVACLPADFYFCELVCKKSGLACPSSTKQDSFII